MPEFTEDHLDVAGRRTAVLSAGAGAPLVFFHGGGIVEGFDCLLPLAERFRLVVPYHPGFEGTAEDPPIDSVGRLVEHYVALLDVLGIESTVLVGHSLGGWIATSLALDHPDRVRRLVLACPFGLNVPGHPLANVLQLSPQELFATLTNDPTVFAAVPLPPDEAYLAARAREGRTLAGFVPGPFDPALEPRLRELATPTLLLWGDDDRVVPVEHAPVWEARLPDVRARIFRSRGHLLFWEDRAGVDEILEFASEAR